jgi:two-component system phosphate regulon response regulator PhoB
VRSVLYRFPDLADFARLVQGAAVEPELPLPPGETVEDGEWVLAVFELGPGRRATSCAGRGVVAPAHEGGARLCFEPRDLRRLADFAAREVRRTPSDPPTLDEPSLGHTPRVLVVDDDPDIRQVVTVMLSAVGLAVEAVESAEEALARAAHGGFDLLVLDWNLPRMSGIELCQKVRKDPALATLPVLFLTANAASQDMVEAFACGADDYVVKPFRAPELGARIFSLLKRTKRR